MLKDRQVIWISEYIFGAALVFLPLFGLLLGGRELPEPHIWTLELFIVCLGVVLISCGSSMRQRMQLARRIDELTQSLGGRADH